jgi:hypothetical protein
MFWVREIAGWALVLFAVYLMYVALVFLMDLQSPRLVEAGVMVIAGLGVLKAGVLLVRISTAARICRIDRE